MKIKINREQFINNPCPSLTKVIMDNYYKNLWLSFRYNKHNTFNKIDTINIRINQSYHGAADLHFYTSINGCPEFHMRVAMFPLQDRYERKTYRYDWIRDFEIHGKIDMGKNGSTRRYKERWERINLKSKSKEAVKKVINRYKTYLTLKKEFTY